MLDPNFHRSVVFLLRHDQKGSLGLVVNRSESVKLSEALPNIDIAENSPHRVTLGGPVAVGHALFLARSAAPLDQAQHVIDDIYYSGNGELLKRLLAKGTSESELRVYAGHAGWAEGQLASEIARGGWHVVRADPDAIFSVNTKSLWENLIERHDPQGLLVRNLRRLPP